jgi:hypothetical protein
MARRGPLCDAPSPPAVVRHKRAPPRRRLVPRRRGHTHRIAFEESAPTPAARRERRRERQREQTRLHRRNALVAIAGVSLVLGLVVGALSGGKSAGEKARADLPPAPTLPGGGRQILPGHRVVALYGAPQDRELGALGIGTPAAAGKRLLRQARAYRAPDTKVLPAMELIASVVDRSPGDDGRYRTRQPDAVIRRYLAAARRVHALLILDIQPGRSDFPTEARVLEKWLRQPDVSLALDPEWRMEAGQVPGQRIGSVDVAEVNTVARRLSQITRRGRLPQKLLVVHQFTRDMVRGRERLARPPGVVPVLDVDGFGSQAQKRAKYRELAQRRLPNGFKLFYKEDTGLMRPSQVGMLAPRPPFVVYE